MRAAIDSLRFDRLVVIYPGERRLRLAMDIEAIGLGDLAASAPNSIGANPPFALIVS